MHEWALAEAVVAAASEAAEKEGLKEVREVKIRVGELQQIELDILEFALTHLKKGSLKNASFTIKTEKPKLKCRACGKVWVFNKKKLDKHTSEAIHFVPEIIHTYMKCPKCGSPDFEILQGRGLWLETVVGVK
jgi:hydrogenase nickel incorporation protein HypA/HybF